MTTAYEIPLQAQPQTLRVTLAEVEYQLTVRWNTHAGCWIMDLADSQGVPIISGFALVTGADLLEQFGYLGIGGMLLAQTDHSWDTVPTFASLGDNGHLFFVVP